MATPERINEIVHELQGTCRALHEVLTDEEEDDKSVTDGIDDALFCCERCSWWHEWSEEAEFDADGNDISDGPVCTDCA